MLNAVDIWILNIHNIIFDNQKSTYRCRRRQRYLCCFKDQRLFVKIPEQKESQNEMKKFDNNKPINGHHYHRQLS
ncbi:hypothetical protein DERP_008521 [Dermatophagoides pteronyssinus]|uniref:Uncharacterized protein n=1 Tax=Dermatophagoides pteronyssinus TaxID=6956 RepID=A0ABQ8IVH4_DERPT|nr:hypothetical protein DERP_008521 [Dermatophagoides pteronyssinus]